MDYRKPLTIEEALELSAEDSVYFAGGTDLGVLFSELALSPSRIVDLCGIEGMAGVNRREGSLVIGPCTTIAEIACDGSLPACLVRGASAIGSPQIRNMATIGGNVCNASPCGDTLTPLMVLDASFELSGARGKRTLAAADFFRGPKSTALEKGEILSGIIIPGDRLEGSVSGFRMTGKRNGQVISQVNMAVWAVFSSGSVKDIRISAGSVAPVPMRLTECEGMISGKPLQEIAGEAFLQSLAEACEREIMPISDVRAGEGYRRAVSGALLTGIITELLTEGGAA